MFLRLFLFWATHTLSLWVASVLFPQWLRFDDYGALIVSGLLFGIVNAMLKPPIVLITLPLTVLTLGLFLLVINAAILLLIAWLVPGFHLDGFWRGAVVALFISIFSLIINRLLRTKR